jgi:hypothetical protein
MQSIRSVCIVFGVVIASLAQPTRGAYTVESVVSGLTQPIHMALAPGDPNSLYIVERSDRGEFIVGRIIKYDMQTQSRTTFLDPPGTIIQDGGLLSMTFHPEYQTNGLFYVVTNDAGTNHLEEYQVVAGTPQFQRRLMQYQSLQNVWHTMNQVHFRPNGNNNELFVVTGDGGTQAHEPNFNPELIEDPNSPYGKVMKLDLTADYPTPADGPSHPGIDVIAMGLRNPFRSSFDRQTGDFYLGDVGFGTVEEIDFIPASHFSNPSAPPVDFGWTDREGTIATVGGSAGGPGSPGDVNPIFDYAHSGQPLPHESLINGISVTAGYVYRGPVAELQGRYFFADFGNGSVYSGTFDTTTPATSFDGTNLTDLQDHTVDFEALVGGGANIRFITSFAEDDAGNLYFGQIFEPSVPPPAQGIIYRIVPVVSGDFNGDGSVDAADYVIWRKNPNGVFTADDYTMWRTNFGRTSSGAAAGYPLGASVGPQLVTVPGPATFTLSGFALISLLACRRNDAHPYERNSKLP